MPMYKSIINHLTSTLSNIPHTPHTIPNEITPLDIKVHDDIRAQSAIGWKKILKGCISTHWAEAQAIYYTQCTNIDKHKYTILRLKKKAPLLDYWWVYHMLG